MIPDLAFIIGVYVIFRAVETTLRSEHLAKASRVLITILAAAVIFATAWFSHDIYMKGTSNAGLLGVTQSSQASEQMTAAERTQYELALEGMQLELDTGRATHAYETDPIKKELAKRNDDLYQKEINALRAKLK